ncbi:TetR/AcrR family transcriptional regulator C-terminal domain-containing protein [Salinicoccus carnicancri]|uniref:TetR/AcrR family transcriptional regulator C-terminal domain-containing protein n=1 Tax=Salinicoccus carnicancri TaxID=558170 RepID=UPI00030C5DC3|nr:TetR/AcrR family transcriptional regulator C-terminal domain-containing protein [Salinicoccus carnicancri]
MKQTDRRVAKSIDAIKSALTGLLEQKSFEEISVMEITRCANVARKTFYLHYTDKYDLLDSVIDEHIGALKYRTELGVGLEHSESEFLWFEYIEKHFIFFSSMLGGNSTEHFRKRFLQLILDDTRVEMEDFIEGERDREVAARFFSYGVLGIIEWWLASDQPEDARTIAERTGLLYHMIVPDRQ